MKIRTRDLGWLEGIIDGEGCLGLYKDRWSGDTTRRGFAWRPTLEIGATSEAMINRIETIVGDAWTFRKCAKTPKGTNIHRIRIKQSMLRLLLPKLQLTVKEKQKILLLEATNLLAEHKRGHTPNDARLEEIHHIIKSLNKYGGIR